MATTGWYELHKHPQKQQPMKITAKQEIHSHV